MAPAANTVLHARCGQANLRAQASSAIRGAEALVLQASAQVAEAEEARLVAVSATFDDVTDEWRAAVAADDRLTLRRVISRLVRRIEVTPIERDGRKASEVAIIFAFEPESSVHPLLAYASDVDWVKNVVAAGGCMMRSRGRDIRLVEPELIVDASLRQMPWPLGLLLGRLNRVTEVLRMRPA